MPDVIDYRQQPIGWKPGIYSLQSYAEYASIKALRSSELKKLNKSPAHYRASLQQPKTVSAQLEKSFAKGKAFDTLILHGMNDFENQVVIEPDLHRATKAYKAWKEKNAAADCILTIAEKRNILSMQDAAGKKRQFSKIFNGDGHPHRVIIWQDTDAGLWCKAEIDWICADGTVVDLKTSMDASFWAFSRNALKFGYPNQGAFYLSGLTHITGIKHTDFLLAVVEVDLPFESHVFRVSNDQLLRAATQNQEAMALLRRCLDENKWPGYPDTILDMDSGHYIYDDFENDEEKGEAIDGF